MAYQGQPREEAGQGGTLSMLQTEKAAPRSRGACPAGRVSTGNPNLAPERSAPSTSVHSRRRTEGSVSTGLYTNAGSWEMCLSFFCNERGTQALGTGQLQFRSRSATSSLWPLEWRQSFSEPQVLHLCVTWHQHPLPSPPPPHRLCPIRLEGSGSREG